MKHFLFGIAAGLSAMAATPAAAQATCNASSPYLVNYQFTQVFGVTAIAKYNSFGPCGSGISNSDTAPIGVSTLTDIFPKYDLVARAMLFGVTDGLPGDGEAQRHLVLFTNDVFAAGARDIAFGTLFPTSNEAALIAALDSLASGDGSDDDYGLLSDFAENAARTGPNGDAGFGLGQTFTSIAFSDGRIIGTGLFYATPAPGAVPESATWALMILGFGGAGVALRRRRALRALIA